jgi:oxygen-independent coproporphyrinogen-3 oxidase
VKKLGIYVHIPFCVRKCLYCDFLSFPAKEWEKEKYLRALLKEIEGEALRYKDWAVDSIFIGGGTPTALTGEQLGRLMDGLKSGFLLGADAEITMEANPGTVEKEKLEKCLRAGVNRISIGAQSLRDEELAALGRVHSAEEFFQAYQWAREAGFRNVNVDVMAALPGQKVETYLDGLERVMDLGPEHISAYSLIIEEGTPFYGWYGESGKRKNGMAQLPSEEEERLMYERTGELLEQRGYRRYEISNYAKPGYECRHNIGYWERRDYAGFGLGASSMVGNVRWRNRRDKEGYVQCIEESLGGVKEEIQSLSKKEQMEEFMFLGLRLTTGVGKKAFQETFGIPMEEVYGAVIGKLGGQGLLEDGERVSLTPYGRDISNYVMAEFLLPS